MKSFDTLTKPFLSITLGISAILLSGSLFIFSLKTISGSEAKPVAGKLMPGTFNDFPLTDRHIHAVSDTVALADENVKAVQAFGLGVREGVLYFGILYNNNTIGLHKTEVDSGDILQW